MGNRWALPPIHPISVVIKHQLDAPSEHQRDMKLFEGCGKLISVFCCQNNLETLL